MKEIPLTQGKVALVDDEDFEALSRWSWCYKQDGNGTFPKGYAARNGPLNGKKTTIRMHRQIMDHPELHVDHIDGNGLNNQRSNLRICTRSQNLMNMNKNWRFDKFKGVFFHKRRKRWMAIIGIGGKLKHLGYFDFSVDAAIAYNEAAKRFFGEFASLNQIPE